MQNSFRLKQLTAATIATLLLAAAPSAFAHTGVKDKILENTATYTALTITHGCASNAFPEGTVVPRADVIAVGAVFPNSPVATDSEIYTLDPATGIQKDSLPDLSSVIQGVPAGSGWINAGFGLVAGGGTLFPNFMPTVATSDTGVQTVRGYHNYAAGKGASKGVPLLESIVSETGLSPFRAGAVKFVSTSCVRSLKVRLAVANWCQAVATDPSSKLDLWMGHTTPLFNDQTLMPSAAAVDPTTGVPYWTTMTIVRNLAPYDAMNNPNGNPMPASCGAGYDVAIQPTSADIDKYLPMPANAPGGPYWPNTK